MRKPKSMIWARAFSLLALAAFFSMPWFGWWALAVAVGLVFLGVLTVPRSTSSHEHKARVQSMLNSVRRRFVRHPWRPTGRF